MADILEVTPEEVQTHPLFKTEEEYEQFREGFVEAVRPIQEKWLEARRQSEEEARYRLLGIS